MFIAYTDASIQNAKAYLAFLIVFEDGSKVNRRIVADGTNSNLAEALAIMELLSFLRYYNMKNGLILFDSNGVKSQLNRRGRKVHNHLIDDMKENLTNLQIRTQVIPRKYNIAHRICYKDKFYVSSPISTINRAYYERVEGLPDFYMQLSVLAEYRKIYNKRLATFHEAQMKLNKRIWLADLVEKYGDIKVYAIHDRRIKVHKDTIVKLSKVNYVRIGNHWRVIKRGKKLKKLIENNNTDMEWEDRASKMTNTIH